ncbi:hypothetical protein [Clostridium sp.]|uniref:hypothetical protein n=1 Tax=Clostridium sp. TaxID=1506 RepID=UPI001E108BAF|nr:hypothetical protein [Clostridium sp.]MBS5306452.1 hypothetical protein [Clostridium sp.]
MKALEILINSINAQIKELNSAGYNLYDSDNVDWYLTKVRYSEKDDRLYFDTEEDR